MEPINIQGTDDIPSVILDKASGKFQFSGRSLPEDVSSFFDPILEWLDAYAANPNPETVAVFKMDYFNTASSKMVLDILLKFEDIAASGKKVKVQWYYLEDDEDMEEAGEEYADIVDLEFEQIAY